MKLKVLSILALAGTVALTGCGANKSGSSAEPSKETQSSSPAASASSDASAAPVDVTWFSTIGFWNPPQWDAKPGTVMGEITKKTGLTFTYNIPAQDGQTKLSLLMVSSGDFPDIVTDLPYDGESVKLAKSGKFWDLEEFLKKYAPDSHLLKDFPQDIKKELIKRDGGWYAIPSHMASDELKKQFPPSSDYFADNAKYGDNKGIVVNTKILKQAGLTLDDLKTEDGLLAALKKVKDMNLKVDGQAVIPLSVDGKNYAGSTLQFLQKTFGAMNIDKDGKFRNVLMAPETKHAFEFLFKAKQNGALDASQLTLDTSALDAQLVSGRVFAFIGNMANVHYYDNDYFASPGAILSNTGAKPVYDYYSIPSTGWMQTFISKSTKHPEQLAKWLDYMTSPEGLILNHYGMEGVDYNKNDQGLLIETDTGIQNRKDASKTAVDIFWPFANVDFFNHMDPAPTNKIGAGGLLDAEVKTAFARTPGVVRYDASVLTVPGDFYAPGTANQQINNDVQQYLQVQISKMVLAKDEAAFNKQYDEYVAQMKKLKIEQLDAALNEELQKQQKEMGVTVKGVNS
ncbi:extracellular solute-binding protein [Cohnella sp. CFH 77786]|uniref:extracellular solute-binding protein n=1 Tax=Cohnella sp. CFH 77786 TaxID=2662265 RepID=UPI001C60BF68|nr:extracellular solute-binding protein [Cohnella sp. CFH 77786]MBW5445281.1 extracellular solute-binding protein [Cohnella sp. CFH 77786]